MPRRRPSDLYSNSVLGPVYNSASYYFEDEATVRAVLHRKERAQGRYGRYNNPTWEAVEDRLDSMLGSNDSLIFASGMAAHFTAFVALLRSGDHVAFPSESYRQVRNLFKRILPDLGIVVHELSIREPESFLSALANLPSQPRLVHLEMPSSPHMYLTDVAAVRAMLPAETIVTMDSSFSPPPNFSALEWGVDVALFSGTKYLSGHGDVLIGVAAGRQDLIDQIRWYRDCTGAVADGHAAFLLNRGLDTLHLRLSRLNESGTFIARGLEASPAVSRVLYTGLESHPHFPLGQKYLRGHGGVVTFELDRSEDETARFVDSLQLPYMASNFGAPQTLVEQSTLFTYFEYSDEELKQIGVTRGMVRLAIGYTDAAEAILADLQAGFARI